MKIRIALALVTGAVIGGAGVQTLHAHAKAPAYIIIDVRKVTDPAAFKAGVLAKANPSDLKAAGGSFVVRSKKFIERYGNPPALFIIQKFDDIDKARAFANSRQQTEISAALIKSSDAVSFIVEGGGPN